MKLCTDLEQSKKLAEILPLESTDMYYKYVLPKSNKISHVPEIGNPVNSLKWYNEGYTFRGKREPITLNEYCVPCWSLAALLDVYPMVVGRDLDMYCCWVNDKNLHSRHYNNPIDACYEIILKLNELEIL